jgi:hypothetical protein
VSFTKTGLSSLIVSSIKEVVAIAGKKMLDFESDSPALMKMQKFTDSPALMKMRSWLQEMVHWGCIQERVS